MWYRVELRKDGAVASCTEVEALIPEKGGRIYYIEADSKEHALKLGLARYQEYLFKQRTRKTEQRRERATVGLCRECGGPVDPDPRNKRKFRCSACSKRAYNIRIGFEEKGKQGVLSDRAKTARQPDVYLAALKHVRAAFYRMTARAFREWLISEIDRLENSSRAAVSAE